jgi:hypothetical protein
MAVGGVRAGTDLAVAPHDLDSSIAIDTVHGEEVRALAATEAELWSLAGLSKTLFTLLITVISFLPIFFFIAAQSLA